LRGSAPVALQAAGADLFPELDILVIDGRGTTMADNIAEDLLAAQQLERAVRLRRDGANWIEVATACDYPSPRAALAAVGAAMAEATARAEMTADQHRDEANLQLEHLLGETLVMLRADAPLNYDEHGNQITPDDRAVKLRAVDEARRLIESKLKLNGVTAPKGEDEATSKGIRIVFEDRPRA
jgi:hypothetical protein